MSITDAFRIFWPFNKSPFVDKSYNVHIFILLPGINSVELTWHDTIMPPVPERTLPRIIIQKGRAKSSLNLRI